MSLDKAASHIVLYTSALQSLENDAYEQESVEEGKVPLSRLIPFLESLFCLLTTSLSYCDTYISPVKFGTQSLLGCFCLHWYMHYLSLICNKTVEFLARFS